MFAFAFPMPTIKTQLRALRYDAWAVDYDHMVCAKLEDINWAT